MIHLDTNFLVHALRAGSDEDAKLREWLGHGDEIGVCAMTWAEFLCGPLSEGDIELAATLFPVVEPLLSADSAKGAELFNATGRRSRSLADCLIAAASIRIGAQIATRNVDDFKPFLAFGLKMV